MLNSDHVAMKHILANSIRDYMKALIVTDEVFSIVINTDNAKGLDNTPLQGPTLFHIVEYTRETLSLGDDSFSFHFGDDNNVEHVLSASYSDIGVLIERGVPIINNVHFLLEDVFEVDTDDSWKDMEPGLGRSFGAFKNNPENAKFFKKKVDVTSTLSTAGISEDDLEPII